MPSSRRSERADGLGPDSPIPNKLYFKIGEVAQLVGVQAHVLRYWEKEVSAIRPGKSASNQRRYRFKDVEIFREIRRLLYDERYTLAGARRHLWGGADTSEKDRAEATSESQADLGGEGAELTATLAVSADCGAQELVTAVAPRSPFDEQQRRELRQGLEELIRLAGEEP